MIVVRRGASLVLVTQSDHAHFAAELLSLWRLDGFPDHPRRDDILFAVREHDNGWREEDAVPRLDEGGLKATLATGRECCRGCPCGRPVEASQSRAVRSLPAVSTSRPSGLKTAVRTLP